MTYFGPTGYRVEIDSYDSIANTVGGLQDITEDITEVSGIKKTGVVVSGTALADAIETEIATGVIQIARIVLKGFVSLTGAALKATGAFKVIGQIPIGRADVPKRSFKLTHKSGITQQIEVGLLRNDSEPAQDNVAMFEAELYNRAADASELVEAGL